MRPKIFPPNPDHRRLQMLVQEYGLPELIRVLCDITFGDIRKLPTEEGHRAFRSKNNLLREARMLEQDL